MTFFGKLHPMHECRATEAEMVGEEEIKSSEKHHEDAELLGKGKENEEHLDKADIT